MWNLFFKITQGTWSWDANDPIWTHQPLRFPKSTTSAPLLHTSHPCYPIHTATKHWDLEKHACMGEWRERREAQWVRMTYQPPPWTATCGHRCSRTLATACRLWRPCSTNLSLPTSAAQPLPRLWYPTTLRPCSVRIRHLPTWWLSPRSGSCRPHRLHHRPPPPPPPPPPVTEPHIPPCFTGSQRRRCVRKGISQAMRPTTPHQHENRPINTKLDWPVLDHIGLTAKERRTNCIYNISIEFRS